MIGIFLGTIVLALISNMIVAIAVFGGLEITKKKKAKGEDISDDIIGLIGCAALCIATSVAAVALAGVPIGLYVLPLLWALPIVLVGIKIFKFAQIMLENMKFKNKPEARIERALKRAMKKLNDPASIQLLENLLSLSSSIRIYQEEIDRLDDLGEIVDQSMQDIRLTEDEEGDAQEIRKQRQSITDRQERYRKSLRQVELFTIKTQARLLCMGMDDGDIGEMEEEYQRMMGHVQGDLDLIGSAKKEVRKIGASGSTTAQRDKKQTGAQLAAKRAAHH